LAISQASLPASLFSWFSAGRKAFVFCRFSPPGLDLIQVTFQRLVLGLLDAEQRGMAQLVDADWMVSTAGSGMLTC
jgi:hypothetical protein